MIDTIDIIGLHLYTSFHKVYEPITCYPCMRVTHPVHLGDPIYFFFVFAQTLGSILNLDLIRDNSGEEIAEVWVFTYLEIKCHI